MTESRNQFEEWFFSEVDGGTGVEELCWQAWQASRAAIVVKLPSELYVYNDRSAYVLELVRDSLDKAGVSYE